MILSGWGNFPRLNGRLSTPNDPTAFSRTVFSDGPIVARGAGRSYGDAALGVGLTVSTGRLDRMLAFDPESRELTVEAGVRLSRIIEVFMPRGFFPPVVPGTANVTVGGMVAANVHGKNHHGAGGMGAHITRFTLVGPDGQAKVCSPTENESLFRATIGGMGLTGLILEVSFRLMPIETSYIRQVTVVAQSLDEILAAFETGLDATYSVAWIDCMAKGASLGRSLLYLGEHATLDQVPPDVRANPFGWRPPGPKRMPIDLPDGVLNPLSIKAFNTLYYLKGRRAGVSVQPWKPYFFPLDAIEEWNRMYGRRGFLQHQCVIPKEHGRDALGEILERVAARASASFLAVLKLMGDDQAGWMSFPRQGYTLALDFPATDASLNLLDELDDCVMRYGGRLYLAKDSRQRRDLLEAGYPNLAAFRALRQDSGAAKLFRSAMSDRLSL